VATIALTRYMPMRTPAVLVFGRKDNNPPPIIPGIVQRTFQAQRWDVLRMP